MAGVVAERAWHQATTWSARRRSPRRHGGVGDALAAHRTSSGAGQGQTSRACHEQPQPGHAARPRGPAGQRLGLLGNGGGGVEGVGTANGTQEEASPPLQTLRCSDRTAASTSPKHGSRSWLSRTTSARSGRPLDAVTVSTIRPPRALGRCGDGAVPPPATAGPAPRPPPAPAARPATRRTAAPRRAAVCRSPSGTACLPAGRSAG